MSVCVCMHGQVNLIQMQTLTCEVVDKLACQFGGNPSPRLSSMGASDLQHIISSTHSGSYLFHQTC